MQYPLNAIPCFFSQRDQHPITDRSAPLTQPAAINSLAPTNSIAPHSIAPPMTLPNTNSYLKDTQPFSLIQTSKDAIALFNILHIISGVISLRKQGDQRVIALAQRNNHHIISESGAIENLTAPSQTVPLSSHFVGWIYHTCAQLLKDGTSYLYHHILPIQVATSLAHQTSIQKIEQADRQHLLRRVIDLYQSGKLGSIQSFTTKTTTYFNEIEQQRLSRIVQHTPTSTSASKIQLLEELQSITGNLQRLYQAEKKKIEPAAQQWQQLFSQLNHATQKVLSKDIDCQEAMGDEGVIWLQNAFGLLNETPLGQLFLSILFRKPSDHNLGIEQISKNLPSAAKETLNLFTCNSESINPITKNTTLAELSSTIAQLSEKMAQCVRDLTEKIYTPRTEVEKILLLMLEATQEEGATETHFLQVQEAIVTKEQRHIESAQALHHFLAVPLILSEFTAQGKAGRRIFKETLRQNLPRSIDGRYQPENCLLEPNDSKKKTIHVAPLKAIKTAFALLTFKGQQTNAQPDTNALIDQGLSEKESPEMRFIHSLRKDLDQSIRSGNLWKGVIDANRMTYQARQHLQNVVQSLAVSEDEKQNFHQLIQNNDLPQIIAWINRVKLSTSAISHSTLKYIQLALYRSLETHTMQMLVQIAHIAQRENRAPHATEERKMQALCRQLIETRTALLGLDPTNSQLQKAQSPNFWRINLKAKAQAIAEHYPKDSDYTTPLDDLTLEWMNNILSQGIAYHHYSVKGMHHIPKEGRCLIAFNHSLATYDIAMFGDAVMHDRGRLLRMLAHDNFFKYSNCVAKKAESIGFIPAKRDITLRLLENEQMVGVCPGGIKEAIKPSNHHKDDVMWETSKGFARLSLLTGAPIVLAACPAANDLYTIKPSALSNAIVEKMALSAPVLTSDAFPKPNPVKLTHYLSPAVYPPALPEPLARALDKLSATPEKTNPEFKALLDQYHHELWTQMQALMQKARLKDQATQAS